MELSLSTSLVSRALVIPFSSSIHARTAGSLVCLIPSSYKAAKVSAPHGTLFDLSSNYAILSTKQVTSPPALSRCPTGLSRLMQSVMRFSFHPKPRNPSWNTFPHMQKSGILSHSNLQDQIFPEESFWPIRKPLQYPDVVRFRVTINIVGQ